MKRCLIVAMSENRVIGRDGQMPWHLPDDLKRFKQLTMGYPIIMGRKTHESIGRILPGRPNVILSRQADLQVDRAQVYADLDQALSALAKQYDQAFIIGGAQIYQQAMGLVDRIYLTQIHQSFTGDTFFPDHALDGFKEVSRISQDKPFAHSYITLDRQ